MNEEQEKVFFFVQFLVLFWGYSCEFMVGKVCFDKKEVMETDTICFENANISSLE